MPHVRLTVGTQAPVHDFGLVDLVAHGIGGLEARGVADGAIDVVDGGAATADQVVVVVTRAHLVAGGMAGRLEATHESCGGERPQHVVDRLVRHGAELSAHCTGEFVGGRVRAT